MLCTSCGTTNRAEARFCRGCGTWLAGDEAPARGQIAETSSQACPSCGNVSRPGARFCANCGYCLECAAAAAAVPSFEEKPPGVEDEGAAAGEPWAGVPESTQAVASAAAQDEVAQLGCIPLLVQSVEEPATAETTPPLDSAQLASREAVLPDESAFQVEVPVPEPGMTSESSAEEVEEAEAPKPDDAITPAPEAVPPIETADVELEVAAWEEAIMAVEAEPVTASADVIAEVAPAQDDSAAPVSEPAPTAESLQEGAEAIVGDDVPAPEFVPADEAVAAEVQSPVGDEPIAPAPVTAKDAALAATEARPLDEHLVSDSEPITAGEVAAEETTVEVRRPGGGRRMALFAGIAVIALVGTFGYFTYTLQSRQSDKPATVTSMAEPAATSAAPASPLSPPSSQAPSVTPPQPRLLQPLPPVDAKKEQPVQAMQRPAPAESASATAPAQPKAMEPAPKPKPAIRKPSRTDLARKAPAAEKVTKAEAPTPKSPRRVRAPVAAETRPAQAESPPPAKVAESAPPPPPTTQPAEPGWQVSLRAELEGCGKSAFLERLLCNERARWRHCAPNRWNSVPECAVSRNSPGMKH